MPNAGATCSIVIGHDDGITLCVGFLPVRDDVNAVCIHCGETRWTHAEYHYGELSELVNDCERFEAQGLNTSTSEDVRPASIPEPLMIRGTKFGHASPDLIIFDDIDDNNSGEV